MMSFILILDFALFIVLIGFNGWNWFLTFMGLSTIEFWGKRSTRQTQRYDYSFSTIRDNLFEAFGTYSLIAILSPSLRNVPFTGIEWSFQMKDLGYNEKGELARNDDEEQAIELMNQSTNEAYDEEIKSQERNKDTIEDIEQDLYI